MYFLFKMGIFHCYVCLPEGKSDCSPESLFPTFDDGKTQPCIGSSSQVGCWVSDGNDGLSWPKNDSLNQEAVKIFFQQTTTYS